MSERKKQGGGEDTYDLLHRQFNLFGGDEPVQPEEEDVKNSGEIYFSASPDIPFGKDGTASDPGDIDWSRFEEPAVRTAAKSGGGRASANGGRTPARGADRSAGARKNVRPGTGRTGGTPARGGKAPERAKPGGGSNGTSKKGGRAKSEKGGSRATGLILAMLMLIIVVAVSLILRIPIMGCINDIIAIDRSPTEIRVVIEKDMTTNDVIDLLAKKDLIYSATFCKFAYQFLGHDPDEIYPPGSYAVSARMGLEGMMREIITAGATEATVKISFPEGYTIDQIIDKLASNGVASSSALYGVIDSVEFIESYDFLTYIDDAPLRYHYLEGYLYPDTYEFYIGENPQSVINRFLKNFSEKWSEKYAARCERSGYSVDEILTVASILEKEAKDAEQMSLISSILYNRLQSSSFEYINCDSTAKYIENQKEKLVANGRYASLLKMYDTYQITGLPIGPICNPGADAIAAALSPDSTDYYYFIHDKEGTIYVASTLSEHEANLANVGNS